MVGFDVDRVAGQLNVWWDQFGYVLVVGGGLLVLMAAVWAVTRIVRHRLAARVVQVATALVVLAWTSEGLWEVARHTLGLPVAFAAMTFFVFEAMMISSGLEAEKHRRRHGTPGPAGRYVWLLAAATGTVVALNAASVVEAVLRLVLPLAATGLWWVGITAERDSDNRPGPDGLTVRDKRAELARARQATWAITPRQVLVRLGIMRPGAVDVSAAEREYRVRRMVVAADRLTTATRGGLAARWWAYRLRRLARLATEQDVAEVRARVARAAGIVATVTAGQAEPVTGQPPQPAPDSEPATLDRTPDTLTGQATGHGRPRDQSPRPDRTGHATGRPTAEQVLAALAEQPRPTQLEVATRLGISERTVRRVVTAAGHHLPAKLTGHAPPPGQDHWPATTGQGNGHQPRA